MGGRVKCKIFFFDKVKDFIKRRVKWATIPKSRKPKKNIHGFLQKNNQTSQDNFCHIKKISAVNEQISILIFIQVRIQNMVEEIEW